MIDSFYGRLSLLQRRKSSWWLIVVGWLNLEIIFGDGRLDFIPSTFGVVFG
jgi:hypothetical protein